MKEIKKTRNTEKQNLVKEILTNAKQTLSAEDIRNAMPIKVNKTTIYRILDRFLEKGEIHVISDKNGKTYYAQGSENLKDAKSHNHIHFQCQTCESVTCLEDSITLPMLDGFTIKKTQCLIIGICNKCTN